MSAGRTEPGAATDETITLAAFEEHRALLFSVAYRMLGSVSEAEDVLQETFIRWQRARTSGEEIRSPRAFLVTIASRLCINVLESARLRREEYVGEWLPEPLVTHAEDGAARRIEVDESVSMAVMLMLERLTPSERAVFLLHEVFDYRHAEIAAVLGVTEENCRQLLRRARRSVRLSRPRFRAPSAVHSELLERFARAAESGDMDQLISLLAGSVVMHTDGGGIASALRLPIYGPERVAQASVHGLRRLKELGVRQRVVEINGEASIVSYLNGRPQSVFTIDARHGRIEAIYIVTNPEKLTHLAARVDLRALPS